MCFSFKQGDACELDDFAKSAFIGRLIKELENLTGPGFELFCHYLLENIVGSKLNYRGSTVEGAPTGYTVDTYSADLSLVGEYGSEKKYFSNNFNKPLSDVDHALKESSNLKIVYLFCNRQATNTELLSLSKEIVSKLDNLKRKNVEFEVYDGRRIATKLVELLNDMEYSSDLVIHFPALEEIIDERSMTNSIPSVKMTNLKRDEEITALSILQKHSLLFLYGISGIGKTELAISIANQLKEKQVFEVIVWVDGRVINSIQSLNSLEIERVKSKQNILGLIKRKRVLLVIDGLDNNIDQVISTMLSVNNHDSKIIITSQKKCSLSEVKGKMFIDFLNDDVALRILNHNVVEECPESIFRKIKKVIGCHPLLFEIINKGVNQEGITWNDIEQETSYLPNNEDTNGQSFFKRLLQSHYQTIQHELVVIKWLEGQTFDKKLLQHLISKAGINKLLARSFLNDYKSQNYKMHDLIYNCIKMESFNQDGLYNYKEKFVAFFSENEKVKNYQYFNALHIHNDKIRRLVMSLNGDFELVPTYLALADLSLIDYENMLYNVDIETMQSKVWLELGDRYRVISYIECVENIHRIIKQKDFTQAKLFALETIPTLEKLLKLTHSNDDLKFEILHHLGKFHTFIGDYDQAKECFYDVISNTNNSYHSKLQLAKFSKGVDLADAISFLRDIFSAFEEDPLKVSITIVLAAFNELKKSAFSELADQYLLNGTLLETAIMYSSVWGYSQPFIVMTEVGKTITYKQPERYIRIVKLLPEESDELKKENELFYLGQVYKELGKCYPINSEESFSSLSLAKSYFEKILSNDCYYSTMIGECYILMKQNDKALEVLNKVAENKRNHFWYQRYSQAHQGIKLFEDALVYIEKAIEGLTKPLDEKYRSAFLRQKAQILISLHRKEEALTTYDAAYKCSDSVEFENEIKNEMNALNNQ